MNFQGKAVEKLLRIGFGVNQQTIGIFLRKKADYEEFSEKKYIL